MLKNFFSVVLSLVLLSGLEMNASDRKPELESLWAQGVEYTRHGQFEKSNAVFEGILKNYRLSAKMKKEVYSRLCVNADLAGDYASNYRYLVLRDGKKHPSEEQLSARKMAQLPLQSIERPDKDVSVKYLVDSLFYEGNFAGCEIRLPITIAGKDENVILDNGCAKYCVASERFAREHDIRPIDAAGEAIGVVETVSMWFGVADSLSVGELLFRNILFVVIPDQYIDNSVLDINAMLGASIFRLTGEMAFDNERRTIVFPREQQDLASNVTIDDNGTHYVEAVVDADTLTVQLDLGSARTALSANYYLKHRDKVVSEWTETVSYVGGVGGMTEEKVYSAPELTIRSCGGTFVRENAKVSTVKKPNEGEEEGAIGNDFLLSFPKARMNLTAMYFYVGE